MGIRSFGNGIVAISYNGKVLQKAGQNMHF